MKHAAGTEETILLPQLPRDAEQSKIQMDITTIRVECVKYRTQLALQLLTTIADQAGYNNLHKLTVLIGKTICKRYRQ